MNETWIAAKGYEGLYEVSSLGRIRSLARNVRCSRGKGWRVSPGKELSPFATVHGYIAVNFTSPRRHQVHVHRLVLRSFNGEPVNGMEACHNDGDRSNNAIANLRWDTRKANHADKERHGTSGSCSWKISKQVADEMRAKREAGAPYKQLEADYGLGMTQIWRIVSGRAWK